MGIEALNVRPINNELVVSVKDLKTNYLFGVSFQDDDGNEMPDSLFEFYIRAATQWVESELEIYLRLVEVVDEAHDFYYTDYFTLQVCKLFCKPIRKLTKLTLEFPIATNSIEFDPEWFRVEWASGMVSLLPTQGSLSKILMGAGGAWLPGIGGYDHLPFVFRASYEAGFEVGKIPTDILEAVCMMAAMGPLNIAGDLLGGAGIASKTLSIDGLSESISTTSSPENAGYGARIIQYKKQLDERMRILRTRYRGIAMSVG